MAPDFGIKDKHKSRVENLLKAAKIPYIITSKKNTKSNYIEVSSVGLLVPKEKILYGNNFYDTQKKLHSNNKKILTPYEFKEFLKQTKEQDINLFNEITQVKSPWRAEWLDADFKMKGNCIHMVYHTFDSNGNIIQKSEKLDKKTLMNNKTPGISLDSWIKDSTKQGLPKDSTKVGGLYYWAPLDDDNSVALFCAGSYRACLIAGSSPSCRSSDFGVRATEQLR